MQLTRVAPITLAQNDSQVSPSCHHAIASDPSTPQAAHSVAVAHPINSDRNTNAISSRQGMRLSDSESRLRRLIGGSARGGGARWENPPAPMVPEYNHNTPRTRRKSARDTRKMGTL